MANDSLKRVKNKDITSEEVARQSKKYISAGSLDPENEAFGHLASAAIRLATIAERHPNLTLGKNYRHYVKGQQKRAVQESKKEIFRYLSDYIHILFRDNVTHIEEANIIYADVRKESIPKISLSSAHSAVKELLQKIESELINKEIVEKSDS